MVLTVKTITFLKVYGEVDDYKFTQGILAKLVSCSLALSDPLRTGAYRLEIISAALRVKNFLTCERSPDSHFRYQVIPVSY